MVLCVKALGNASCDADTRDAPGYACGNASDVLVAYVCWSVGDAVRACSSCGNSSAQFFIKSVDTVTWISASPEDITTGWTCESANDSLIVTCSASAVNADYDWSFLLVALFILAGGLGNILVCLAIAWERRLQNITNYFLLSLAIADLLVSLFVMPLGAIQGFLGKLTPRQCYRRTWKGNFEKYLVIRAFKLILVRFVIISPGKIIFLTILNYVQLPFQLPGLVFIKFFFYVKLTT